MPVGMEVGFGRGNIVLDGDPAPTMESARHPPPSFRPMFTVASGATYDYTRIHFALK